MESRPHYGAATSDPPAIPAPDNAAPGAPARVPAATAASPRIATFLLAFSMFSTGASGLISEYILATVSSYILGNSIEQFSVIIGLMLAMMGFASWIQKFMGDRNLIERFLAVEVALALLTSAAPLAIYAAYAVLTDHFALVQYLFVMSIGFLIGFEIPLILRINERYAPRLSRNVAVVFSADYIGGLAGALIWAWVLLRYLPLTEISVLVAGINFVVAASTFLYFRRAGLTSRRRFPAVAIIACAAWLGVLYASNRRWAASLEQRLYEDPIVLSTTTRYQHIVLTHDPATDEFRLYINGNTQFSSADERIYHEHLVHPAMVLADRHARVLVLGGGDGLAMREVLKYPDVRTATLVDLDPEMTRLAAHEPELVRLNDGSLRDARVVTIDGPGISPGGYRGVFVETGRTDAQGRPRTESVASVQIMNVDAFRFVDAIPGRYDVIIADFPDPNAVELVKLYSREFYTRLRQHLAAGGVAVVQATSPYHSKEAFLCIRRTLEAAGLATLPYHDNVPSFGEWGWILAWRRGAPPAELRDRIAMLDRFPVPTSYLTPDVFRAATVFGRGWLDSGTDAVNTLLDPVLLGLYLREGWKID
ncbi:MAG TPA: polyamine aminopropyltransferase [Longimicrobiales bacterium]